MADPRSPDRETLEALGPLAPLVGVWEGEKGDDVAPSDDRGTETNKYRERMTFTPIGRVDNHEQVMYGLSYATMAWRLGEDNPFHQEVGYWLWDPGRKQVMRCFLVPRGVAVIAGGTTEPDATELRMAAELGSATYGVLSNKFLDEEFRTVAYTLTVRAAGGELTYEEDSVLLMKGRSEPFHHRDGNTLRRVG